MLRDEFSTVEFQFCTYINLQMLNVSYMHCLNKRDTIEKNQSAASHKVIRYWHGPI